MIATWKRLEHLYLANATLLITHEIDSAYWHEWAMFAMPGGIQLFLILNMVLAFLLVVGLKELVLQTRWGLRASLGLGVIGIGAFVIHASFLAAGRPEFRLPASLAILVATLAVSCAQSALALRALSHEPT